MKACYAGEPLPNHLLLIVVCFLIEFVNATQFSFCSMNKHGLGPGFMPPQINIMGKAKVLRLNIWNGKFILPLPGSGSWRNDVNFKFIL